MNREKRCHVRIWRPFEEYVCRFRHQLGNREEKLLGASDPCDRPAIRLVEDRGLAHVLANGLSER